MCVNCLEADVKRHTCLAKACRAEMPKDSIKNIEEFGPQDEIPQKRRYGSKLDAIRSLLEEIGQNKPSE